MRISRLRIRNFRSIRDLDVALPGLCALVGPNNSGKSNILKAIYQVIGRDWVTVNSFSDEDVFERNLENDVQIELTFAPPLSYSKYKHGSAVAIDTLSFEYTRYKIGENKGQRRLEQKCYDENGKPPMVLAKAPKRGEQQKYEPLVNIPAEIRESIPLIYIGTNRSLQEHLPRARNSLLRQLLLDVNEDFHSPSQTIEILKADSSSVAVQRSERFKELMASTIELLHTDKFVALEASIKKNALLQLGFDPDVDTDKLDLFFGPFDTMDFYKLLELQVNEPNFTISATELGEGMQNAIVLSILQAFEERRKNGAIFLIEEPEMFLHPQMQRSLYKTLKRISATNQVIYTTHSPHFVSVPDYGDVRLVRRDLSGTYLHSSTLESTAKRREKLIKELDPERNEMFFAQRLLLVEGDTEKLALPEYANRLAVDLDRAGASIVEVGGKTSLMEFAQISISFGIPTGILFDLDSKHFKDAKEEEKVLNEKLIALGRTDADVKVWTLPNNYEDYLRHVLGEVDYLTLCQKYPSIGKPSQARLIAADQTTQIPPLFTEIVKWLGKLPTASVGETHSSSEDEVL